MEAMACGRAVVATDAGDVPSLVEDGKTGFVVARGDEATLLARMATLMTDPDLCQRMGEAGLDHGVGHPSDSCPRWKHLTH
jgi:glycosyltransferase involved in cell wall biosynthesis